MLGKNLLERIKNLNSLTKLDVLDLHSNQITKIENLSNLAELRVLNLANNSIAVLENLEALKSVSEINLRRNLIGYVQGLTGLSRLQRLFLSNNRLDRLESIQALGNCPSLTELALDGNSIHKLLNYSAAVLDICKNLTFFDLKKVTNEMKETVARTPKLIRDPGLMAENMVAGIEDEWKTEVERLKALGLNSFRCNKTISANSLLLSGHAEIENETSLFIYGNALEVITRTEFYESVSFIKFQFLQFDAIVHNTVLAKLSKFIALKKIGLKDNNLNSFIQLSKLEPLQSLRSLEIENNDVNFTTIFRSFVVYRFPGIQEINNVLVNEEEKVLARQQFQNFDKLLVRPSIFKDNGQDVDVQRSSGMNLKRNASFAKEFVNLVIHNALSNQKKMDVLEDQFKRFSVNIIKSTTQELGTQGILGEDFINGFNNINNIN